jgi:hypothetical protein
MRAPTPTEQRLLAVFLAAAFLALNAGGCRLWRQVVADQNRAIAMARNRIAEGEGWLAAAEAIGGAGRPLPPLPKFAGKDASSALIAMLRRAAAGAGLTIIEESLPEPPDGLPEKAVVVRLRFSGPFEGCVRFLYEVQQPDAWRSIEQAVIKADSTPQNVLAELEIRQYFDPTPGGAAPVAPPEQPPENP